jgi:hypothetical protein
MELVLLSSWQHRVLYGGALGPAAIAAASGEGAGAGRRGKGVQPPSRPVHKSASPSFSLLKRVTEGEIGA